MLKMVATSRRNGKQAQALQFVLGQDRGKRVGECYGIPVVGKDK